jgi:hypothetical protein
MGELRFLKYELLECSALSLMAIGVFMRVRYQKHDPTQEKKNKNSIHKLFIFNKLCFKGPEGAALS